jgi:hypothetical protein
MSELKLEIVINKTPKDKKKYLSKNEFRMDNNPAHFGVDKKPHPAYITARYRHMYKANCITHARFTSKGEATHMIGENPNKLSKDKKPVRITQPFWQNEKQFSKEKLTNFRFSNETRKQIRKINKKYK